MMKKKIGIIGILLFFLSFILVVFVINATGRPSYGETHSTCHPGTGVTIQSTTPAAFGTDLSSSFQIPITATGPGGFSIEVLAGPNEDDNDLFTFNQSTVTDGGIGDLEANVGTITTVFNITAPGATKIYTIIIVARDSDGTPEIAFLRFEVNVGGAAFDVVEFVFDHLNYILGGIAIVCLAAGTILYQINREKYVRVHGILAGTSLILTTINVILVVPATVTAVVVGKVAETLNLHLLHIILGVIGYVAAIVALLTGLSGHRTRVPGFIALACWGFNYIQGLLLIFGGIGF